MSGVGDCNVVNLANKRRPVIYTLSITHHWDDSVDIFVRDVADDERSREAVRSVIGRAAVAYSAAPIPQADALHALLLQRIDALMQASPGTPEASELSALADAVQAYEQARYPVRHTAQSS